MANALGLSMQAMTVEELGLADVQNPEAAAARQSMTAAPLKNLRQRHHAAARHLADGKSVTEVALIVGLTPQRITQLQVDPAFADLVEYKRKNLEEEVVDFRRQLANVGTDALIELQDRMESEPEKFTNAMLLELAKTTADRTGHGPSTTTTHNLNIGIGQRLKEASSRVQRMTPATIIDVDANNAE